MWRSGITRRRRHVALAEMVEMAQRSGDYTAPWLHTPGIWEFFHDESEILRELQQEWRTALAGAVYIAIEQGEGDLQNDVMQAFAVTCQRHRGVRSLLERHSEHPAIAAPMRKERALLSSFSHLAGITTLEPSDFTPTDPQDDPHSTAQAA